MSMIRSRRPLVAAASFFVPVALTAQAPSSTAAPPANAEPAAEAQEPDRKDQPKNRVVVTASGFREDALDTPYTFQQLDNRDITDRGYRTLPEALAQVPGVMVQKTAHGHGSPFIRGFTGRQNLVLIDGVRFNNSIFRGGPIQYWNTIDALAVDHLEVVKSQGSVLFGSDAVGGTVSLTTKSSHFDEYSAGRGFQHGSALYRFDSNGASHTARLEGQVGVGGEWGLHVGVTYRDFGDIHDRVLHTMPKTGYDEFDYDLRLDVALGDDTTLTLAHQRVQQDDIWRTHRTVFFEPWNGTSLSGPDLARVYDQDRDLSYLKIAGGALGFVDSYRLTFSYQNFREDFSRIRNRTVSGTPVRDEQSDVTKVATAGVALAMESHLGDAKLVYGFDYYRDDVDASTVVDRFNQGTTTLISSTRSLQGPVGDDAFYDLAGVYVQGRLPAGEAVEFTAGARYTYARADIGVLSDGGTPETAISAKKEFDDLTFNLRGNVRLNENWHAYAGASQAFRAPNIDDLSALKSSRTDLISTGSLDIEPEEYLTYELGTRYLGGEWSTQASVFYTRITDQITSRPIGTVGNETVTTSTNGSDGYVWGGEVQTWWDFAREWRAGGSLAYVDGEEDTFPTASTTPVRQPLSRLMPVTGWLSLRWTGERSGLWVEGRVIAAGHAGRLNSGDAADTSRFPPGGTPSYVVAFLSSGYQVTQNLELNVTLENVTNTSYRTHGSGVNQPGTNLIVGGRVSW
ncbi:MAG: TonB-dependent receptor [Planctomycetes bacterium]|nr:TonB-dependent receptor [Planctomycetota bacterium]